MPVTKCRYCNAVKGSRHDIRCQTRTTPTAYPADATVYITTYTDTSGGGTSGGGCDTSTPSGGCDTSSTTTTTDSGSCG